MVLPVIYPSEVMSSMVGGVVFTSFLSHEAKTPKVRVSNSNAKGLANLYITAGVKKGHIMLQPFRV
jgi:hypothetical protein